jgi:lytic murein transglycosylase
MLFSNARRLAPPLCLVGMLAAGPASAVPCGGEFEPWLESFKREAAGKGISQATISAGLAGVTFNPQVIALDRRQGVFKQSFEQFGPPRVAQRLGKAQRMLQQHAGLLSRIEQQFGVPGPVVVAIWGLETDFGVNMGKQPALRALATLAHDCRRTERFQNELLDALKIIDRGDLAPGEMRGAWAGELGQTQFLPSSYFKFAVDFDGNGRRDLIRSVPDVLASTANYLKGYGWRRGQPWTEGSQNFEVLREWNQSQVYQRTIALFASRLAGE